MGAAPPLGPLTKLPLPRAQSTNSPSNLTQPYCIIQLVLCVAGHMHTFEWMSGCIEPLGWFQSSIGLSLLCRPSSVTSTSAAPAQSSADSLPPSDTGAAQVRAQQQQAAAVQPKEQVVSQEQAQPTSAAQQAAGQAQQVYSASKVEASSAAPATAQGAGLESQPAAAAAQVGDRAVQAQQQQASSAAAAASARPAAQQPPATSQQPSQAQSQAQTAQQAQQSLVSQQQAQSASAQPSAYQQYMPAVGIQGYPAFGLVAQVCPSTLSGQHSFSFIFPATKCFLPLCCPAPHELQLYACFLYIVASGMYPSTFVCAAAPICGPQCSSRQLLQHACHSVRSGCRCGRCRGRLCGAVRRSLLPALRRCPG